MGLKADTVCAEIPSTLIVKGHFVKWKRPFGHDAAIVRVHIGGWHTPMSSGIEDVEETPDTL